MSDELFRTFKKRGGSMRGKMLILVMLITAFLGFGFWHTSSQAEKLQREIEHLRTEIQAQELQLKISRELLQEVIRLRAENEELHRKMQEWLDTWEVDIWEATAYAPLDPRAKRGVCYAGDPHITASGTEVIPYVTAAAGPDVALGTRIYVAGAGPRIVQDRGGKIGHGQIDLAVETREEAIEWGRRTVKVVYENGSSD